MLLYSMFNWLIFWILRFTPGRVAFRQDVLFELELVLQKDRRVLEEKTYLTRLTLFSVYSGQLSWVSRSWIRIRALIKIFSDLQFPVKGWLNRLALKFSFTHVWYVKCVNCLKLLVAVVPRSDNWIFKSTTSHLIRTSPCISQLPLRKKICVNLSKVWIGQPLLENGFSTTGVSCFEERILLKMNYYSFFKFKNVLISQLSCSIITLLRNSLWKKTSWHKISTLSLVICIRYVNSCETSIGWRYICFTRERSSISSINKRSTR